MFDTRELAICQFVGHTHVKCFSIVAYRLVVVNVMVLSLRQRSLYAILR